MGDKNTKDFEASTSWRARRKERKPGEEGGFGLVADIMFVMVLCFVVLLITMLTQERVSFGGSSYDVSALSLFAVLIILFMYLLMVIGRSKWRGDYYDFEKAAEQEAERQAKVSLASDIMFVMVLCFVVLLITMITQNTTSESASGYNISFVSLGFVAAIMVVYLGVVLRKSAWKSGFGSQEAKIQTELYGAPLPVDDAANRGKIGLVSDIMFVMVLCFVVLLITMLTQNSISEGTSDYSISIGSLIAVAAIMFGYVYLIISRSWWRGDSILGYTADE